MLKGGYGEGRGGLTTTAERDRWLVHHDKTKGSALEVCGGLGGFLTISGT